MNNHRLNESKIGSAKVIVDILPKGKCIPDVKMIPTSITVHMTGNVGASAKNNHNYMKNCNKNGSRKASWHITVDDKEIYQAQSFNYKCYHAGNATGNNTSIGIEIAMFDDKDRQRQAYQNAIELIKIIMKYYGFKDSQVKRHYDWTRKNCPQWLIEGKWGYTWDWFKGQLKTTTQSTQDPGITFKVKILVDTLNIRSGPNTTYPIVGQVHKDEVFTIVKAQGAWGYLKSGAGWINTNPGYCKKI